MIHVITIQIVCSCFKFLPSVLIYLVFFSFVRRFKEKWQAQGDKGRVSPPFFALLVFIPATPPSHLPSLCLSLWSLMSDLCPSGICHKWWRRSLYHSFTKMNPLAIGNMKAFMPQQTHRSCTTFSENTVKNSSQISELLYIKIHFLSLFTKYYRL